jgi:hypothetical protein
LRALNRIRRAQRNGHAGDRMSIRVDDLDIDVQCASQPDLDGRFAALEHARRAERRAVPRADESRQRVRREPHQAASIGLDPPRIGIEEALDLERDERAAFVAQIDDLARPGDLRTRDRRFVEASTTSTTQSSGDSGRGVTAAVSAVAGARVVRSPLRVRARATSTATCAGSACLAFGGASGRVRARSRCPPTDRERRDDER